MNSCPDEIYKWKLEAETHWERTLILNTYLYKSSGEEI